MPDSSAFQAGYAAGAVIGVLLMFAVLGMGVVSIIMAFVRRTAGWIVMAIIFSLLGLGGVIAGVAFAARGFSKVIAQGSKAKTVVSEDGWVSLETPGTWTSMRGLHESASLKVGNKFREEYAMVLSESKSDFVGTLDDFAKITTGGIREKLGAKAEVGSIEDTTAGKFSAKRCRLAGRVDNIRIVYLHYSIETPAGFHQLIMWTLPSKERGAWPAFERVAESFQEVNPPKSEAVEKAPGQPPRTARKGTVEERLRDIFVEQLHVTADKVKPDAKLKTELGADDLDLVELVMACEEEFAIEMSDDDVEKLTTVREFTEYVSAKAKSR